MIRLFPLFAAMLMAATTASCWGEAPTEAIAPPSNLHALFVGIDDYRHSFHGFHDLFRGTNAVAQPVGNMLTGNPQSRPILHQPDVIDVGNLGTADALVNPAHDITQDALGVVVEFCLYLSRR